MEISFENKTISAYREIYHQSKRVQESAESVVPDTDDDIGRIASVQTGIMLKSKDVTARGVVVSGEASASILYITEEGQKVSFVRLSRGFSLEYELADIEPETVAQISLSIVNCECRVLNPRKISVTFEISGELSCYRQENLIIDTKLPANGQEHLYARYESAELMLANAACEKTFGINEQFSFPSGKPSPSRLVSQKVDFAVSDKQLIGSKLIIKGNVNIAVCYLSDDLNYPITTELSTPFSQIIDIGQETMDNCSVNIELTSAYFDLISTISGDKAMDAELHAVIQIVSRSRTVLSYIADAYSNRMPVDCTMQSCQFSMVSGIQKQKLSGDERISVAEDCSDVLSAFVSISELALEQGKVTVGVGLDVIYRDGSGILSSVRRTMSMEAEAGAGANSLRLCSAKLSDVYLRPDGQFIDGHISAELCFMVCGSTEIKKLASVSLDEDAAYDLSKYPSITLVKAGNESLWELAKVYHSSVEQIKALNQLDEDMGGKLLLIPKAL